MNARDLFIRKWIAKQTEPFFAQQLADALNNEFHSRKHMRYQTCVPILRRLEMLNLVHGKKVIHKMPVTLHKKGVQTWRYSPVWKWTTQHNTAQDNKAPDSVVSPLSSFSGERSSRVAIPLFSAAVDKSCAVTLSDDIGGPKFSREV